MAYSDGNDQVIDSADSGRRLDTSDTTSVEELPNVISVPAALILGPPIGQAGSPNKVNNNEYPFRQGILSEDNHVIDDISGKQPTAIHSRRSIPVPPERSSSLVRPDRAVTTRQNRQSGQNQHDEPAPTEPTPNVGVVSEKEPALDDGSESIHGQTEPSHEGNTLLNLPPPVPFHLKVHNLWVGVPHSKAPSYVPLLPLPVGRYAQENTRR